MKPLAMNAPAPLPEVPTIGEAQRDAAQRDAASPDRLGQLGATLGAFALMLAVATVVQVRSNNDLQAAVAQGQTQIAKAQALANVDNELVGLLAKAAAENHDDAIRGLLAQNGVTFKAGPAPGVTPATGTPSPQAQN
ncbi:MAG: hypothetical protein ACRYG4_22365 [Janthinobacterium lividum]